MTTAGPTHLTSEQIAIIEERRRHLMVEAGPGSGKTTTIVNKVLHEMGLADVTGVAPESALPLEEIVAITFTRKAAGELRERIRGEFFRRARASEGRDRERWVEMGCRLDRMQIGTIDAFAGRIIRDYGALGGMEAAFEVMEPGDYAALCADTAESELTGAFDAGDAGAEFLVRQFGFERARSIVVRALDQADLLAQVLAGPDMDWGSLGVELNGADRILESHAAAALAVFRRANDALEARMAADGVLSYVHVVLRAAELVRVPEVRKAINRDVRLLIVDEHQDTSRAQVSLLFRIAGIEGGDVAAPTRLVLVGDPKQGIYSFRHADITMWDRSRAAIEGAGGAYRTLSINHRSRPKLVRFFDETFAAVLGEDEGTKGLHDVVYRPMLPGRTESQGTAVEVLLADQRDAAMTAEAVAERVAAMLANPELYPVLERQADGSEAARPLRARDIAILSRSLRSSAEHYERALRERGVNCHVYGGRGLYARPEVQDVARLLRAVADAHDPRALAGFLRSPFGKMDDVALAELASRSTAAKAGESVGSLYEALLRGDEILGTDARRAQARRAVRLLETLRRLRDRLPHDQLIEVALEESGFGAFLAGAPDAPVGLRNVEKLVRVARRARQEPLFQFVERLAARVDRADPEEEAPIYAPEDEIVVISTIHAAKGLEWPYVILTGIDENLFWKVPGDAPQLDERVGLALPLDVEVRDEAGATMETHSPATWALWWETATQAQFAEGKRLFFVGATRARDRLILAGALKATSKPRKIGGAVDKLHLQGVEHWLRHLYKPVSKGGDTFTYGADDVAEIRRGVEAAAELRGADATQAAPALRTPLPESYPSIAVDDLPAADAAGEAVRARLGRLEERSAIRREFSASELLAYDVCPMLHLQGYRGGMSTPVIEVTPRGRVVDQVLPEKRGDILHDFFRAHQADWGEERMHQEMKRALLRHLPMPEDEADANARELLQHAIRYVESAWFDRVQNALEVHREVPFVAQIDEGTRIVGEIDVLFREADGWRVLDFKTGRFGDLSDEDRLRRAVRERARKYEVQAGTYSLAAAEALGSGQVKEFVFFFTDPGLAETVAVSDAWLEAQREKVGEIVRHVRAGQYDGAECDDRCGCQVARLAAGFEAASGVDLI